MLEIVQAKDFKKYYPLFIEHGIQDEVISVVEALSNDAVIGYGIYYYKNNNVVISCLNSYGDIFLYDGIVRAILYLAISNNVNSAEFCIEDKTILKELKFIDKDDYIQDLIYFLEKCKNCKK